MGDAQQEVTRPPGPLGHTRPRVPLPAASEPGVLRLQRLIGNRAVGLMLQRQDDPLPPAPAPPPLLDDAAVAGALAFYQGDPARYTPAVISQLQDALHIETSGVADEALAQAVATFQFSNSDLPPLLVDGKAGPRTLPRLVVTGLAAPGEATAFGHDAQHEVMDRWTALGTAEARSAAFAEAINRRFDAIGVPRAAPRLRDLHGPDGEFDFPTWTLSLDRTRFGSASLTRVEAADLVDTVYHEARHCEQWFRMAQMRAGQHVSAGGIAAEMGIPVAIARRAAASPIAPGTVAAATAQGWFDSVYGSGAAQRDRVLAEVESAQTAHDAAAKQFERHPTAANQARLDRAQARFDRAFAAYQNLPEENDAWVTGPRAATAVTRGTDEPDPDAPPEPISGPDPEDRQKPDGVDTLPPFPDQGAFFADDDVVAPAMASMASSAPASTTAPTTTAAPTVGAPA